VFDLLWLVQLRLRKWALSQDGWWARSCSGSATVDWLGDTGLSYDRPKQVIRREESMRGLCALACVLLMCVGTTTARAEAVDLAIVFAADMSRSVDDDEFKLQRQGYAAAVADPSVLRAIAAGQHGGIAICFIEWSGPEEQQVVAEWTVIRDGESAASFAATLLTAPRSFAGRTSISAAIDFSRAYAAKLGVGAERRIIDISGDGTNNSGRPAPDARDEAVAAGFTINGLAIINENPNPGFLAHTQPPEGLPEYYRQNVIGGPGSFLLVVQDFNSFGQAITNKLVTEIAAARRPENVELGRMDDLKRNAVVAALRQVQP
jgi:Protein of unknown function (DUF1194)